MSSFETCLSFFISKDVYHMGEKRIEFDLKKKREREEIVEFNDSQQCYPILVLVSFPFWKERERVRERILIIQGSGKTNIMVSSKIS